MIAGVAVGGVAFICLASGILFFFRRRRKTSQLVTTSKLELSGSDSKFELPNIGESYQKAIKTQQSPVELSAGEVAVEEPDEALLAPPYTRRHGTFSPNGSFFDSPNGLKSSRKL